MKNALVGNFHETIIPEKWFFSIYGHGKQVYEIK